MKQRIHYLRPLPAIFMATLLLAFLGVAAVAQTSGKLSITMTPELFPAFDPEISDYIVRAGSDDKASVMVDAPKGTSVSVDGQPFASQKFTAKIASLAAGQSFRFDVQVKSGKSTKVKTYYVRRTPKDFPVWTVQRPGAPQAEYYVIAPNLFANKPWVIVSDNQGVPIWWYRSSSVPVDPKFLAKDRIGWMNFGPGEEHLLDGTRTRTFLVAPSLGGYMDPHELLQLPPNKNQHGAGNYVFIAAIWKGPFDLRPYGGLENSYVLDNVVEEVTSYGALVWSWSSLENISVAETDPNWRFLLNGTSVDPYHMNSVERVGETYVISQRHMNAVICVDRKTGKRLWKLGGTPRPESLSYVGDAYGNFGGNHDARVLSDGTLTVHDNGTTQGRPPRGVRYRLDAKARTATLLEQITDSNAPSSGFTGSARRLPEGNWVTEWGGNPFVTELTGNGDLVFRMTFADAFSYRAAPVLPGYVDRTDLRKGMNKQFPR